MKKEIWLNYLESQVERCRQEEALSQDCREDEARRAKIRGISSDLRHGVPGLGSSPAASGAGGRRRKLEALPENWRAARVWPKPTGIWPEAAVEEWKLEAWQQAWDQLGKEA